METKQVPEFAKKTIQNMHASFRRKLEDYLSGVRDGMGLDGSWTVNLKDMAFVKGDTNGKGEPGNTTSGA